MSNVYRSRFQEYTYDGYKYNDEESLEGGLADEQPIDEYPIDQLEKGIGVELEHTDDPSIAAEIAADHIEEIPDYYDRLEDMEAEAEAEIEVVDEFYIDDEETESETEENKVEIEIDLENTVGVKKIEVEVYLEKYQSIYNNE